MPKNPVVNQRFVDQLNWLIESGKVESPAELARLFEVKPQYISQILSGKDPVSKRIRKYLKDNYGEFNPNYVTEPTINYKRSNDLPVIPHDPNGKKIPFIDTDVYATITPSLSDVVALKPETFINIPMFSQGEYAVQVTGHSIYGLLENNFT